MTWKSRFIQWLIRKRAGSDWIGFEDSHEVLDATDSAVEDVQAWSKDRGGVHVLIAAKTEFGEIAVGIDSFGEMWAVQFYGYIPGGRVVQRNAD